MKSFKQWLDECPLVAILRGVRPEEVVDIVVQLQHHGIRIVEVPLNSPEPFTSIALLSGRFGDQMLVGAGTVLDPGQVLRVMDSGGKLIVTPHAHASVVESAKKYSMFAVPGFATPTEAFAMINAGADAIKLFPAEANPPKVLKAMRAVLPRDIPVLPVGSITPETMADYWNAGANGFGLGSALYKAGDAAEAVAAKAAAFTAALKSLN